MKITSLLYFGLLVTLFAACSKESIETECEPTAPSPCTPFPTSSQTRSVLYVNNFGKIKENFPRIVGNTLQEDSLLNWCLVQGFTELNLGSIGNILDADSATHLNDFVCKAHSSPYGFKINFMVPSSARVNQIDEYCANYPNKPDGIITEYEFWNDEDSFGTFLTILSAMTDLHQTHPSVRRYAYVHDFEDQAGTYTEEYITQHLILNCEAIFLANYENYTGTGNAYNLSNNLSARLAVLGENAQQISTVANVIIIFKVHQDQDPETDDDIFTYFSVNGGNHDFVDAYNNLMDEYNDTVNPDNDGLSFKGYAIFHHTDARRARP